MQTVVVKNISKTYRLGKGKEEKIVRALDDVSFGAERGEIFGFLGPDGAGKTSLFRILTTLILPDSGSVTLEGLDVVKDFKKIRHRVGYMPGKFALYQDLTVEENLSLFATIFNTGIEANYHLIKDIYSQIEPFKHRRAGQLSGGMKQKLALSCALIHKPDVLILDEPTTGVDAVSRKEFWDMLGELKKGGLTILVSTPYMDEAARCDRVALMQAGKLMAVDTPEGITRSFRKPLWAVRGGSMFQLLKDLRTFDRTESCYAFGDAHHLVLKDEKTDARDIFRFLTEKNHHDLKIERITASIEDCFMDLMNDSSDGYE
ncbi:MAG TPA: ABC transporter ATP-binding protein [Saprospiraceae bacterium]|nr:ABC transporter ATP-binding protein [Saprospiraceae bacterium]